MKIQYFILLLCILLISACTAETTPPEITIPPSPGLPETPEQNPALPAPSQQGNLPPTQLGLTYQNPDGNRYLPGTAKMPTTTPLEINLAGTPVWVVGAMMPSSSIWLVSLEDGGLQVFEVGPGGAVPLEVSPPESVPGKPQALSTRDHTPVVLVSPSEQRANYSHQILLNDWQLASLEENGDLILVRGEEIQTIEINALPDGRILADEQDQLLVLSGPTDYYDHGVLGDDLEASSITLINTKPILSVEKRITLPAEQVIEGISPIWADINQDGEREIIVTQSGYAGGAQIVIYDQNGEQIGSGNPIGQPYRWRHQLAVGPFGPAGEIELVDVLTPHIGGVIEYFQLAGEVLVKTASLPGYTSHVYGTRNLDMALGADLDNDGKAEILLPSQQLDSLGLIHRTENGAEVEYQIPLAGKLTSNLAAVRNHQGQLLVAAGLDNHTLQVWLP